MKKNQIVFLNQPKHTIWIKKKSFEEELLSMSTEQKETIEFSEDAMVMQSLSAIRWIIIEGGRRLVHCF